jgi:hypothetical protein
MLIQVITTNFQLKNDNNDNNIIFSDISRPVALDDFDVVIIDLSDERLWRFSGVSIGSLDDSSDLRAIREMVYGSEKAKIVYVFPQDGEYSYHYHGNRYMDSERIRNIITNNSYRSEYMDCFPCDSIEKKLIYEPTTTIIEDVSFNADFHFIDVVEESLTKSEKSCKITTIKDFDGSYYTTLDICSSSEKIKGFVNYFFLQKEEDIPDWVKNYVFFDDENQKNTIKETQEKIASLEGMIEKAEDVIKHNNRIKSILFANGDLLVEVVFEILEDILNCDLTDFVDEKKEDFRINVGKDVFIGEIKGIASNVKNEHISQLDVHYQGYLDEKSEEIDNSDVHGLLIINPFRTKTLEEREPIHENQIALAKRNGSLIIPTATLLNVYELFLNGKITSEDVINVFKSKTGLLEISDFAIK